MCVCVCVYRVNPRERHIPNADVRTSRAWSSRKASGWPGRSLCARSGGLRRTILLSKEVERSAVPDDVVTRRRGLHHT